MKKQLLLLLLAIMGWTSAYAQIPDGSIAPNFAGTDLNGKNHSLYSLLDSGYIVFLDVSATWCGPCWSYHNSGALEQLYNEYGPNGSNEVRVFFAEGDPMTNQNCLYGPAGCVGGTQGNWVAGTPYPIIHSQGPSIANLYQISFYPTIFCICPYDRKVYEVGQLPAGSLYDFGIANCAAPALVIAPSTITPIKCYNTSTGTIDITPSGGIAPYTYAWSNGATTQDLVNVPAGTYTVTVTGRFGTQAVSDPIEVESPGAALSLLLDHVTVVGCNGNLGTATVVAEGGWNSNYTYRWQNGQDSETAYSLNPGNHLVSVTDDNQCTASLTVNLAPAVYPTAVVSDPGMITCNQASIQLNGSGSSSGPEFEYQWFATNGGNIVSGGTTVSPWVNAAGNYSIRVRNNETTCTAFATKTVTDNLTPPTANAGPAQHISCTQPQATLQGSGSTGGNFTYLWTSANGGNIVSGGTTLSPVINAIGDYTLKVTNTTNGCSQTSTTTVTGTPAPALTTTSGTLNCVAASVTLITTSNAASPSFSWSGPNAFVSTQQSPTVSVSGSYNVVVTDSITTCTSTATANVTVNTTAPGASAAGNTLTCMLGNVVITAATPDTLAKFAWTGPNNFSSTLQNPTVSLAGTYNLVVTDTLNGCTSTASAMVNLNNSPPLASAISPGNLNCLTTQLQLNGTGSAQGPNISYAWTTSSGGHIISGENTQTPLVDAAGNYSLLVSNSENGCTQSAVTTVVQSAAMAASIPAQTNVRCNGAANGQASAVAVGGNGIYTFNWSNGATAATISGLAAGTYLVVVTDGENCSATSAVSITQPAVLAVNATAVAQTAFGQNDGSATANPVGGTSGYTFAWDNGETTQTISGLAPGNYKVVVTDQNGCSALQTVTVNAFNCILAATISGAHPSCYDANNGTAEAIITAGAQPATFLWSNGATTATLNNLAAGLYTVNITDGNNCPTVLSINIVAPQILVANATVTAETALNAGDGTATANPTGGTGAFSYIWNTGATTAAISNLLPGIYTVMVRDENDCVATQSVEIQSFQCAISSQQTIVNVSCAGAANGSVTVSLAGGTAPFTYNWSNGGSTATISNLSGGVYTVNISDANGCNFSQNASVSEPAPFTAWELQTVDPFCPNDATGLAEVSISGGTAPYGFLWSNGASGNVLNNVPAGDYTVQVTDANGCSSSTVVSLSSSDLEAPLVSAQNATIYLTNNGIAQLSLPDLAAQFSDNCGVASTSILPQQFDCTQLGEQLVTLTVTDLSGNTATTSVLVQVVDQLAPKLTCPADIVTCSYNNTVFYASVVVEDNCLIAGNGTWTTSGPASGAQFPEGTTTVFFTYADASGNQSNCSFEVMVTAPVNFTNVSINNDVNSQQVGSVDITLEGGTGPFQYEWTDENGIMIAQTEDVTGLGEGIYQVQVTDANGCIYTENDLKLQNTSSAKEPAWLSGVSLQPNPANGFTDVVFGVPVTGDLEISVIDATGRILFTDYSEQESVVRIDCSTLPGGVYSLRFRTGQEIGVRKLVVTK